ncbi:MAG: hypothetical protein ACO1SX_23640 [Actinomycetota bacterium]
MSEMEISKPVGIGIAAAAAVLLVGLVCWFAFGRAGGSSTTPNTVGVPAVASPAMPPPDAAFPGGGVPGQGMATDANGAPVAPGVAMAPGQIPR